MEIFWTEVLNAANVVGSGAAVIGILLLILFLFLFSVVGCILPVIPGPALAFLGIVIWKFTLAYDRISYIALGVCLFLTILAQALDWWLPIKYTPSKSGAWGAFVGVCVGAMVSIFFPPFALFAIFLSPLIFAFAFDFISGKEFEKALKTGFGAFLGTMIAVVAKLVIILFMILVACADFAIN